MPSQEINKIMRKTILIVLSIFILTSSCKKDDPIYDINQIQKGRRKVCCHLIHRLVLLRGIISGH